MVNIKGYKINLFGGYLKMFKKLKNCCKNCMLLGTTLILVGIILLKFNNPFILLSGALYLLVGFYTCYDAINNNQE